MPPAVESVKEKLVNTVQAKFEAYLQNKWFTDEDNKRIAEKEAKCEKSRKRDVQEELSKMLSKLSAIAETL